MTITEFNGKMIKLIIPPFSLKNKSGDVNSHPPFFYLILKTEQSNLRKKPGAFITTIFTINHHPNLLSASAEKAP
ncbi:MAG: hypothetical protein IKV89_00005, partial [Clostridia bacterium]|nr:hypothetical protein [Clostridia bacterium]